MKKLVLLSAIALSGLTYSSANAQLGIHIGLNLAPRPVIVQAPRVVYEEPSRVIYNNNDDFYYLPDVEAYYSVPERCYYYMDGGRWVSAAYLPGRFRYFDWRSARRFEVRSPRPYLHHDFYRAKWGGYANNRFDNHYYGDRNHFNGGEYGAPNRPYDRRGDGHGFENGPGNHDHSGPGMNDGGFGGRPHFPNQGNGGMSNGHNQGNGGMGNGNNQGNGGMGNGHNQGNGGMGNGNNQGNGGNTPPTGQNGNGHHQGNGGNTQPTGQNGNGHNQGNGGDHYTQNNKRPNFDKGGYARPGMF